MSPMGVNIKQTNWSPNLFYIYYLIVWFGTIMYAQKRKGNKQPWEAFLESYIDRVGQLVMFSKKYSPECVICKRSLRRLNCITWDNFISVDIEKRSDVTMIETHLLALTRNSRRQVPLLFHSGQYVGGYGDIIRMEMDGSLPGFIYNLFDPPVVVQEVKPKTAICGKVNLDDCDGYRRLDIQFNKNLSEVRGEPQYEREMKRRSKFPDTFTRPRTLPNIHNGTFYKDGQWETLPSELKTNVPKIRVATPEKKLGLEHSDSLINACAMINDDNFFKNLLKTEINRDTPIINEGPIVGTIAEFVGDTTRNKNSEPQLKPSVRPTLSEIRKKYRSTEDRKESDERSSIFYEDWLEQTEKNAELVRMNSAVSSNLRVEPKLERTFSNFTSVSGVSGRSLKTGARLERSPSAFTSISNNLSRDSVLPAAFAFPRKRSY